MMQNWLDFLTTHRAAHAHDAGPAGAFGQHAG